MAVVSHSSHQRRVLRYDGAHQEGTYVLAVQESCSVWLRLE